MTAMSKTDTTLDEYGQKGTIYMPQTTTKSADRLAVLLRSLSRIQIQGVGVYNQNLLEKWQERVDKALDEWEAS